MLLAAIAADPRTPPAALEHLAQDPTSSTALALLTNPAFDPDTLPPTGLDTRALHRVLPALRPAARARALMAPQSTWALLHAHPDLTPDEIAHAADALPHLDVRAARALARNPHTPTELAERALRISMDCHVSRTEIAVHAIDRGLTHLDPQGVAALLDALKQPGARGRWETTLAETTDPATARHAIEVGAASTFLTTTALIKNLRLPAELRAEGIARGRPDPSEFNDLFDDMDANLIASSLERARSHIRYAHYVEHALGHPDLTADHLHAIHTDLSTGSTERITPTTLFLLALHPNTPTNERAQLLAHAEASRAYAPPPPAAIAAAAHTVANHTALHLPLSTLRSLARPPYVRTTRAHLATALSTYDLTTHHVRTIAALERTFPGTAHELITTALTIHK